MMSAVTAAPMINATRLNGEPNKVSAKASGTNPDDRSWNSRGNGPTEAPPRTVSARPLKMSMPASVTMNAGIL
jgi:hypothetical protein